MASNRVDTSNPEPAGPGWCQGQTIRRTGYLLIGPGAYSLASKYLNEWDLAVTEPPHVVALTDRLPAGGRKRLLVDAVNADLETVPIEVDLPENYTWTRYGFSLDPSVIRIREGYLPARPSYVDAERGPHIGHP